MTPYIGILFLSSGLNTNYLTSNISLSRNEIQQKTNRQNQHFISSNKEVFSESPLCISGNQYNIVLDHSDCTS